MPLFPQNLKQLVTKEQSQILDQQTQKIEDLSEEQLMERAGREISRALLKDFPNRKKIVILVGSGVASSVVAVTSPPASRTAAGSGRSPPPRAAPPG